MFELLDIHPDINVQQSEYSRLLGYPPDQELGGRAQELAEWARQWYAQHGRPFVYARQASELHMTNGELRIDGAAFSSERLLRRLKDAQAESVVLVAVSAGKQCEEKARELWQEEKPDEYFFLEVYGSALVEHLIALASFRLCEWADRTSVAVIPHYSPGYPGWEITEQHTLLAIIQQESHHTFPEGIRVLHTGMLLPKKSLLAVFGVTRHVDQVQRLADFIPCDNCSLTACQYRRAPYKHVLPHTENVQRLLPRSKGNLLANTQYSFSARALRKWAQERLQLTFPNDRSIDARFRYEGTTCSNMGRPLEFEYHITLVSAEEDYRIIEASCTPSPHDEGHKQMCEYIAGAASLMKTLEGERPLLGKSLSDVLRWKREFSPSGCYCTAPSRAYKWGLVFEVLHYALAQHETQPEIRFRKE